MVKLRQHNDCSPWDLYKIIKGKSLVYKFGNDTNKVITGNKGELAANGSEVSISETLLWDPPYALCWLRWFRSCFPKVSALCA